jgi:hypothetical protein
LPSINVDTGCGTVALNETSQYYRGTRLWRTIL